VYRTKKASIHEPRIARISRMKIPLFIRAHPCHPRFNNLPLKAERKEIDRAELAEKFWILNSAPPRETYEF
jgi:hypothetical protein